MKMVSSTRDGKSFNIGAILVLFCVTSLLFLAAVILPARAETLSNGPDNSVDPVAVTIVPFTTVPFSPADVASSGLQDDYRLFIVQQNGIIQIARPDGTLASVPFLDIQDRIAGSYEMGLLGLTFDPDYANNDYFYVNYTHREQDDDIITRVSRFQTTSNPDIADPDSEFIIISVDQPYETHNAGDLSFGPDGHLYIGLGDGGSGGDPGDRAQDPQELLGKMLRIDVSGTTTTTNYLIPPDNPYVGNGAVLDEIWSTGLRNPWRFSFDRTTGDMYIGDVGQDTWEEIDFQPAGSSGGENWGWRCYEGSAPYNTSGCASSDQYDFPIHAYHQDTPGCAVTGGFVYRGSQNPELVGRYLFADYCGGQIWSLAFDGAWQVEQLGLFSPEQFTTFGESNSGEVYVASKYSNEVFRIVVATETFLPVLKGD